VRVIFPSKSERHLRYWCLVTSRENWEICRRDKVWGMDFRYFITLERYIHPGDRAVVYSHGGVFVAEVEISSEFYEDHSQIGWTKYGKPYAFPYRVKFDIYRQGEAKVSFSTDEDAAGRSMHTRPNLIDDIVFIADKGRTWNQYLQVSVIALTEEDFLLIASKI